MSNSKKPNLHLPYTNFTLSVGDYEIHVWKDQKPTEQGMKVQKTNLLILKLQEVFFVSLFTKGRWILPNLDPRFAGLCETYNILGGLSTEKELNYCLDAIKTRIQKHKSRLIRPRRTTH